MGTLRSLTTGEERPFALGLKQISQVAFSPSEELLAVVSRAGTGGLWETATLRKVTTLRGFLQAMSSVSFSPDGKRLAIGSDGNEAIKLWDVDSLQELLTLEGEGSGFHSTAFSADGNLLGSCNRRGTLHVWIPASFAEIARLEALIHSN
jgi:WD40 repeat protein